jgi:hypothetical protein
MPKETEVEIFRYFSVSFSLHIQNLMIVKNLTPPRGVYCFIVETEVLRAAMTRELCWRERKLLIEPRMPGMSKGRSQTKCRPWSSRLGFGRGANNPTPENISARKYEGGQDPHRVVACLFLAVH